MRARVEKEKDGLWYCYDSAGNRIIECGRFGTEASAIESLSNWILLELKNKNLTSGECKWLTTSMIGKQLWKNMSK